MDNSYRLIQEQYRQSKGDLTLLWQTILAAAVEIGLDQALGCLEQCVIDKRLAWLEKNLATFERTGEPVMDGYRLFYESYLGISAPVDGQIVVRTDRRLVSRWWNPCPTLDACRKLGLDTRQICRKVYHRPVQLFLSQLDPRLKFERNYQAVRPYATYCEEIITLAE